MSRSLKDYEEDIAVVLNPSLQGLKTATTFSKLSYEFSYVFHKIFLS